MPPASVAPFPLSNLNPGFNYQTSAQLNSIEPGTSAAGHGHYLAPMQLGQNIPFQQPQQGVQYQPFSPAVQSQQYQQATQNQPPQQNVQLQPLQQGVAYSSAQQGGQFQSPQQGVHAQFQQPQQGAQFQPFRHASQHFSPSPNLQCQQAQQGVQFQPSPQLGQLQQPQQGEHLQQLQQRIKELERELGDARVRLAESEEARVELGTRVESLDANNATLQEQLDVEVNREAERGRSPYVHIMLFASSPIYKAFGPAAVS